MRDKSTSMISIGGNVMVEKKMYRGKEVDSTPTHKEVDTKDLVYRGVSKETEYFSIAKARCYTQKRRGRNNPLYYRGVTYRYTT